MDTQTLHNLPRQPNRLLGREHELEAVRDQLLAGEARLLTFTGPPGVGKTRLALAAAEMLLPGFPDGVWFADLAPLRDPTLVGSTIAALFGVAEFGEVALLDGLTAYLQHRRMLLILDNFEQVLPAATWTGRLLERVPGLKIIATSRERLRLRWERSILVQPLALPNPDQPIELAALAGNPAVALFIQRAAAVDSGFKLTGENAPIIAELCARLDGLPLAIELAAARASAFTPAEILAHMDRRFRILGMGAMDLPERHQTLRAAIDWSYSALSQEESRLLRRLSVFSGAFSTEAVETVWGDGPEADAFDGLVALVEKSLVSRVPGPAGRARFVLLESIRDYLLEKLREGDELEAVCRRHALYYMRFAERNYVQMKAANQKEWFDRLEAEHDNLRAAIQWSLDVGEPQVGKRIVAALWYFWWLRGHIREGVRWVETFLVSGGGEQASGDVDLRVLEGAGLLRGWQGDATIGLERLRRALDEAGERDDAAAQVRTLGWLGWVMWVNGITEQAAWLAGQMEGHAADTEAWDSAYAFLSLGSLLYEAGLDADATQALERALSYFKEAGEKHGAIFAAAKLGLLNQKSGEIEPARSRFVQALEAARQLNDVHVIAYSVDDACLFLSAQQHTSAGEKVEVVRILGAVDHWREILSLLRTPREKQAYNRLVTDLTGSLGESAFHQARQVGQALTAEEVIQRTLTLLKTSSNAKAKNESLGKVEGMNVSLSEREQQVIRLVAEGYSNQEIADRLYITERTVRFHVNSIFNKLGADNRTQAVNIVNRLGLLN